MAKNNGLGAELTKRQQEILTFIAKQTLTHKRCPTVREIAEEVGLASPSSVKSQLDTLEHYGYIIRQARLSRSLSLSDIGTKWAQTENLLSTPLQEENDNLQNQNSSKLNQVIDLSSVLDTNSENTNIVPLAGHIAAGNPITAEQHIEEYLPLPTSITGKGELFALKVRGDSMIEAAICDGDLVVIRAQKEAANGEIVAAMIDGEATVKVLSIKDRHVWILPCNENYSPIPADNCEILGKVVSVLRSL